MSERIAVVGLGYVGLPVALAMAKRFPGTLGFDIDSTRVEALRRGADATGEHASADLQGTSLTVTDDATLLQDATMFIVAVPTPIDERHCPDLRPLLGATEIVARALRPGDVVVYESTVYPGVTEEVCGPLLERVSGLPRSEFKLGYSPERINPGDKQHTFERITKVVAGEDAETLARVAAVYGAVVEAGVHRASSIRVAEAAKAIENTQRDLNIALMNELALIFDRIGIRTREVLDAASTKWNFLRFEPGLVGGHCIGVDPYYLTTMAEAVGYHPQVILAGRRINEGMGSFLAQRLVKFLAQADVPIRSARVGILGLTFKNDVRDLRNTKVVDVVSELRQFGIEPMVHDPLVDPASAKREYGLRLAPFEELSELDGLILAVPHRALLELPRERLFGALRSGGFFLDLKSCLDPSEAPSNVTYWSL
jgi:UDP-N-acetyl-D-galactosamine dehydrogenase